MATTTPTVTLGDGVVVPQIGFGTFDLAPEGTGHADIVVRATVDAALEAGYRHIDTAPFYGSEAGIGRAIASSGIPRDELFVTSKLGNADHRPDDVRRAYGRSLELLGLDQLDLYLIHWPVPERHDLASTWQAMVELVADGALRSAGVSNFLPDHLDQIIGATGVAPSVNQIEMHPWFANAALRQSCLERGVAPASWSPLGQGAVLTDDVIVRLAAAHDRTPAQIVLRWHVQLGLIVIPRTTNRRRMADNLAAVDFELSDADIAALDGLDRGETGRTGPHPTAVR